METFIVNLAFVAAHAGEKVLLLDSNIRQPRLHSLLACPLSPGLTDLLANSQDIYKSIHTVAEGGLHFIPAGALTPTESGVLEPPALDTILKYGRETYDLILCVAPSVLAFSDAAILSSTVDATCFILTGGVSRLPAVIEAKAILESVQARIIGSVLVL
jgi:Mrp family chromosome partitioning ATPase